MERDGVNFYSRNKNDFILAGSSRKYFLCYEQVFLYKIHSLSSWAFWLDKAGQAEKDCIRVLSLPNSG